MNKQINEWKEIILPHNGSNQTMENKEDTKTKLTLNTN